MSCYRYWIAFLLILSVAGFAETEMERDFAWFETLGFPDTPDKAFVRVDVGSSSVRDGETHPIYLHGFLVDESEERLTILTLDFAEQPLVKKGNPELEVPPLTVEEIDFAAHVEELLKLPDERGRRDRAGGLFPRAATFPDRSFVFAQAWRASKRGQEDLAIRLYARAREFPSRSRRGKAARGFRESLEAEIAHVLMWKAVLAFGIPRVGLTDLLAEFERIAKHFPNSEHAGRARQTAVLLRGMIEENEAHKALTDEEIQLLPVGDQVEEWLFRLRDQNGQQWSQPGSCDIFMDWAAARLKQETPAHRLVALGYDAVPGLIASLNDLRFTRSVGYHRDFYFSHHVLRVGDCAAAILGRITGEDFFNRHWAVSLLDEDPANRPQTKEQAERWWAEFQETGEEEMLVRGVSAGGDNAPVKAEMLAKRYPDRLLDALVAGIAATRKGRPRTRLVGELAAVEGDAPVGPLRKEMTTGPVLASRVAAAEGLLARGQVDEAVAAMIREWKVRADWIAKTGEESWPYHPIEALFKFLLRCDDDRAARAVRESFREDNRTVRYAILDFLWRAEGPLGASGEQGEYSAGAAAEIEHLLVLGLEDLDARTGLSGSRGDKSFSDPRYCDIAAEALAAWFPARYEADISASLKKREARRIRSLNTWRRTAGLEPVVGEPFPEPEPVELAILEPLLARMGEPAARAAVEKLGLGVLPILLKRERALPEGDPAKAASRDLVMRLANRVVRLTVDGKAPSDRASWLVAARRLEGSEVTPGRIAEILREFARDPDPKLGGISLKVIRHDDLTGVDVHLTIEEPEDPGASWNGFNYGSRVQRGTRQLFSMSGTGTGSRYLEPDGLDDLLAPAGEALAYPPDEEATIRESMTRDAE